MGKDGIGVFGWGGILLKHSGRLGIYRSLPRGEDRAVGSVAQRLEQGTHNPLVPGSNPGGPKVFCRR